MRFRVSAMATALIFVASMSTGSSLISQFNKTTNDGWFSITQQQANYLGHGNATGISFFRVREGNGTVFNDGDYFDQSTIFNSVTAGASNIIALVNGANPALAYTGGTYDTLGKTMVGGGNSYYRAVGILMSNTGGNLVFAGTSTFNVSAQQTYQGALDLTVPSYVPLPAALPLLAAGLGGLLAMRRRKI